MVVIRSSGVKSPAAPAYSPLTPLATRKEADNNNYSPIPPMSPSTLELFETLSYDLSPVALEYTDSKIRQSNGGSYSDLKEDGDFDADTVSDYVPDSGAETDASHSSVKQNRRKNVVISESDSLENETITEGLIQNSHVAAVQDNQTRTCETLPMPQSKSPPIVENAVRTDKTVDEIISMCQGAVTVEAVQPEVRAAHPITSNDAPQTTGRSKRGRKRKHTEYCLSEKKDRKYMNLPYHIKDKIVRSKEFYDYTCTCQHRCHLLV